eukprot:2589047-Pleurochrysis_carterae.AAC.1
MLATAPVFHSGSDDACLCTHVLICALVLCVSFGPFLSATLRACARAYNCILRCDDDADDDADDDDDDDVCAVSSGQGSVATGEDVAPRLAHT